MFQEIIKADAPQKIMKITAKIYYRTSGCPFFVDAVILYLEKTGYLNSNLQLLYTAKFAS